MTVIFIWLGIGIVIGGLGFGAMLIIPRILDAKEKWKREKDEERESFLRCQAYLDYGGEDE